MPFPGYPLTVLTTDNTNAPGIHPALHNDVNRAANDLQAQLDALTAQVTDLQLMGKLDYMAVTANQGSITTETDLSLSVSFNATVGRFYKLTLHTWPQSTVTGDAIRIKITDNANLQFQAAQCVMTLANVPETLDAVFVSNSLNGTQNFKGRILRQSGTGTITNNASALLPSFLLVEDMG